MKESGRTNAVDEAEGMAYPGKSIYMVSDGTGWTAEHSVNAALGQFDYCLVDRVCPVSTHLFSGVSFNFLFCLDKLIGGVVVCDFRSNCLIWYSLNIVPQWERIHFYLCFLF